MVIKKEFIILISIDPKQDLDRSHLSIWYNPKNQKGYRINIIIFFFLILFYLTMLSFFILFYFFFTEIKIMKKHKRNEIHVQLFIYTEGSKLVSVDLLISRFITTWFWTPIGQFRHFLLYVYTFYSRYNTDRIAYTEIGLDPYKSVIKRLWCIMKIAIECYLFYVCKNISMITYLFDAFTACITTL